MIWDAPSSVAGEFGFQNQTRFAGQFEGVEAFFVAAICCFLISLKKAGIEDKFLWIHELGLGCPEAGKSECKDSFHACFIMMAEQQHAGERSILPTGWILYIT